MKDYTHKKEGKCEYCKEFKLLTRHSEIGGHKPPYVYICIKCHQKRDGNIQRKKKLNKKVQDGTHFKRLKK